jgi:hypothetical protein
MARVVKMMDGFNAADITSALNNLIIERNPPSVEQLPNYVSSQVLSPTGAYNGITLAVLDSVQGHGLVSAATRAYDRAGSRSAALVGQRHVAACQSSDEA